MHISAAFDSGNIEVLAPPADGTVRLAIRKDHASDFFQWFHFRASGVRDRACRFVIANAGQSAYAKGWPGYRACCSADRETWTRVPTRFDEATGELTIEVQPDVDVIWLAYFAPYSWERHQDLLADAQGSCFARVERLGATLDGRDLDVVRVGTGAPLWVTARQHPGESMAEWWVQGFLGRLLDPHDALARDLRDAFTFHVVPNTNPDGSVRGHLRTNAAGVNLNRVWHDPQMATEPEVALVLADMIRTGCALSLDVHGDENLPYNFIAAAEGTPSWDARRAGQLRTFLDAYERANPDFQSKVGYPKAAPGQANMTMASNALAERFGCLAMTLEMPFKDTHGREDAEFGWSPERCVRLGESALDAIAAVLPALS